MDFNQYSFDEKLAEEGRVITLDATSNLTICRWGNKAFVKCFNELTKPYGNVHGFGKFDAASAVPDDDMVDIMRTLVASTILIGWEGMHDDGTPMEYSVNNAVTIFTKHPSFLADIIQQAQDDATFKAEKMDEELENSEPSSEASSESVDGTNEP